MIRGILTRIVKEIGLILLTILVIGFGYGVVLNVLNWALQFQWGFPCLTIPFIALLVFLGIQDLKTPNFPIRKALATFIMTILIAAIGFGALSHWLVTVGWATYAPENLDLFSYNSYYLWQFLDMIPLLKVNDTLGLTAPLQPVGFVAGLPILVFRILVLFGLLKALKAWWDRRNEKAANKAKSQSVV